MDGVWDIPQTPGTTLWRQPFPTPSIKAESSAEALTGRRAASEQVEDVLQPALGGVHIGRRAVAARRTRRQRRRARLWQVAQL